MKKMILYLMACCICQITNAQYWNSGAGGIYYDAGNVGIGTTTPISRLTIAGGSQGDGVWLVGTGTTNMGLFNNMTLGAWNGLTQVGDNMIMWKGSGPDNASAGGMVIGPWSNGANGMRITASGNIGIGTGNPRQKVDIWDGDLVVTGTDMNGTAYVTSRGGTAYYSNNTYSNGIAILPSGNVLIGKSTQSNATYILDIAGNVRANQLVVNTTGADFVFDPGYTLSPLSEVEAYINYHHHLPGIDPAVEMQKNGMDVGNNQTRLLQKVEELTLYMIEQNKELKALKEQDQKLAEQNRQLQEQNDALKIQEARISRLEMLVRKKND